MENKLVAVAVANTTNSLHLQIKVAKLNNYEASYETQVTEARNKEVLLLRQELAVWATTLCITVVSPMLASAATFTTYVLIDENNILTAAKTFAVLLLFSALRFPINYAGRLMGSKFSVTRNWLLVHLATNRHPDTISLTPFNFVTEAAQALSAVRRITQFLNRELREEKVPTSKHTSSEIPEAITELEGSVDVDTPLRLENASFRLGGSPVAPIGSSKEVGESSESGAFFKVSDITVSVQKGEVLAVCGPVGCGK